MNARRLAVAGLVILFAVIIGVLARWQFAAPEQIATAPEASAPAQETTPGTAAPATAPRTPESASVPGTSGPAQKSAPEKTGTRPTFDVVRVEPAGDAIVAGRAAPGSTVELLSNGAVIDRTKANEAGEFVLMPPPLEPGSHELVLRTADAGSRQAVTISVPEPGKGEVLVVVGEPGKPSQVVQAGAPEEPSTGSLSGVPGYVQTPAGADTPLRIGAVEAGGGRLFVQGSGPPDANAVIYLNDAPLAEARIGQDGRWSLTVSKGLAAGNYKVRVDQIGSDGKVAARAEVPFAASAVVADASGGQAPAAAVAASEGTAPAATSASPAAPAVAGPGRPAQVAAAPEAAPAAPDLDGGATGSTPASQANPVVPEVATVEVQRGDNLWQISRRLYGEGIRYSTIYEANADQIRDPDRIYPGQIFVTPGG